MAASRRKGLSCAPRYVTWSYVFEHSEGELLQAVVLVTVAADARSAYRQEVTMHRRKCMMFGEVLVFSYVKVVSTDKRYSTIPQYTEMDTAGAQDKRQ